MESAITTGSRRRGGCKNRRLSRRVQGTKKRAVAAGSSEEPEKSQVLPALHAACFHGDLASVRLLVDSKEWCINSTDLQGHQPVHMALFLQGFPNNSACLRYLLEHGANVNAITDSGQTPLHLAASKGLLDCVEILVNAGADVSAKDNRGCTPLDLARVWSHRKVARYLKNCLWEANKRTEMEERKLAQALYRDLVTKAKGATSDKKGLVRDRTAEGANEKGRKNVTSRMDPSKYHTKCLFSEQICPEPKSFRRLQQQGHPQEDDSAPSKAPTAPSPWSIYMGLQPEKPPTEPDLRHSVTLFLDSSTRRLFYTTKWDSEPHPVPKLPLDVVERVLFPRAFRSRISGPECFVPQKIDELQHRRRPQRRSTSPWTEVIMHLVEVLLPGHF
ncbi:ankyrin repeat domain-containing protein 53 [Oryzias melastigma]|uniref:Ankyrin repeat domain-containing protein 53-like n=1 Tax=Oryzias melastigma TaxID=30732 RepID=A0A3B3DPU7_ORYME|nr:ankyrin repeat domain-containing protein 53 [Oryzias melastigma]